MIYFIFLISIIFHELGHILLAKLLRVKIKKVRFKIIGFSAEFEDGISDKNLRKIFVLFMGPLVNLIIGLIVIGLKNKFKYGNQIIYTNFILFIINILPVIPLDGGRILFYILNLRLNFESAFEIINNISKIFLILISFCYAFIIFVIKNVEIFFFILYLWYLNIKEEVNFAWYIKINKNVRKYLNL